MEDSFLGMADNVTTASVVSSLSSRSSSEKSSSFLYASLRDGNDRGRSMQNVETLNTSGLITHQIKDPWVH